MNTTNDLPATGSVRARKPWTAANLSLLLAGLGQIYSGAFRRGILQMVVICLILVAGMTAVALEVSQVIALLVAIGISGLAVTLFSGWDAYRIARRTRADYRLKEYNRLGVYAAFCLFFFPAAVGSAFIVRANLLQSFVIAGESMSPTLEKRAHVLVRKGVFREDDPVRGDLVVFLNPADRSQHWIKRIVGVPGDEIEVLEGVLRVNGEAVDGEAGVEDVERYIVPEHYCYVLGDNLEHSNDSRHFGPVPMIALVGKVVFVF